MHMLNRAVNQAPKGDFPLGTDGQGGARAAGAGRARLVINLLRYLHHGLECAVVSSAAGFASLLTGFSSSNKSQPAGNPAPICVPWAGSILLEMRARYGSES